MGYFHCLVSEITEHKHSLIKMLILEETFKRHLEAFASELFKYVMYNISNHCFGQQKLLVKIQLLYNTWKNLPQLDVLG